MPLRLNSVAADELFKYRSLKLAVGVKPVSIDRYISYIDDFYLENNINQIIFTKDMNDLWLKNRNDLEGNTVRYTRTNYLIEFLSYLSSQGYEVVIPRRLPYKESKFVAKIFTQEELIEYFEYIDSFKNTRDSMAALYTPIIFRVLIGCGTRIGETLALKVEDVDLCNGIIHLKETKNGKFRSIPVSRSLHNALKLYGAKCLYLKNKDDFFFSHIDGRKVQEQTIYNIHRQALNYAGIPYIRHAFAVNSLKHFEERGCDLNNVLPILCQYLGHSKISATEKYLQLVNENYNDVLDKTKNTESIIMEVK